MRTHLRRRPRGRGRPIRRGVCGYEGSAACSTRRHGVLDPRFRRDDGSMLWRADAMLNFYGKTFSSRLLIGSALYPSPAIMQAAIRASGAGIVTVSLRREAAGGKTGDAFWSLIRELDVTVLPNTAGCRSVREAVTTAKLARELFGTSWIKLEVIADNDTLQPDVVGLVEAADDPDQGRLRGVSLLHRRPQRRDAAGRCRLQGGDAVGGADRQRQGHHQPRCAETAARPPARHHAGGRCRPRRAVARRAGARTRLRRRAAQHRDRQGRRSRRDGQRVSPRRRGRPHRL